jgi:hypothetical protein
MTAYAQPVRSAVRALNRAACLLLLAATSVTAAEGFDHGHAAYDALLTCREYSDTESERGLRASHQTSWTALLTRLGTGS